jgi:Flp pilus assembly protein TadD
MGQLADAIKEQDIVLSINPRNADDWNNLGVLQARAGETKSARIAFEHALALNPQLNAARSNLSHL